MQNIFLNTTIADYLLILRDDKDESLIFGIETKIKTALGNVGGGFDVGVFLLSKDLLIFQCKLARCILDRDNEKIKQFEKKIEELKAEIKKRSGKEEKATHYQIFVRWLLSVEKYLGFAIDKQNDLNYLIEATKQMVTAYESQKSNLENKKYR